MIIAVIFWTVAIRNPKEHSTNNTYNSKTLYKEEAKRITQWTTTTTTVKKQERKALLAQIQQLQQQLQQQQQHSTRVMRKQEQCPTGIRILLESEKAQPLRSSTTQHEIDLELEPSS